MKSPIKILLSLLAVGLFGWLAFGFFGIQALFTNKEVNEEIPDAVSNLISDSSEITTDNELPQQILGKGAFEQGDSTYTISGNVFLSQVDGSQNVTFTDFEVSNGPDLYVYAIKTSSTDNKTVKNTVANGEFIRLGKLKGNIGNQSYTLESDLDLSEYGVISIWCQRFSRNFGSALLTSQ